MTCASTRSVVVVFACIGSAYGATAWLDVPYVRQVKSGCGAAAVAMVVQYWARHNPDLKDAAAETDRINELLPASTQGIRGSALKDYLGKRKFAAYVFDGEIEDLRNHLGKGRPVIVCLGLAGANAALHYAVVVGIDGRSVWLHDSARGKLIREPIDRFQNTWDVTGHWALLAVPQNTR